MLTTRLLLLLAVVVTTTAFPTGPGACMVGTGSPQFGGVHSGFGFGSVENGGVDLAFDGVTVFDGMQLVAGVQYTVSMTRSNLFLGFLLRMDKGEFEAFTAITGDGTEDSSLINEPIPLCDSEYASVGHTNPARVDMVSVSGAFVVNEAGSYQMDVNVVVGAQEWYYSGYTVEVVGLPSSVPSDIPSDIPSLSPSAVPSVKESSLPSAIPSDNPSMASSTLPSLASSNSPTSSSSPSTNPSGFPSIVNEECQFNESFNETLGECQCIPGTLFLGDICVCFSGSTTVVTADQGTILMKDLKIGDSVQVSQDNKFEPVYSFGHYSATGMFEYLVFNNNGLEISEHHMLAIQGRGFVPASSVQVGESLVTATSTGSEVVKDIRRVTRQGAFAPFTLSGTIMVNGVLASSFVALKENQSSLVIGDTYDTGLSWHSLALAWEAPHRLVCHYLGQCPHESYNKDGISLWVSRPFEFGKWWANQSLFMLLAVTPLVLFYLGSMLLLETLLVSPTAGLLLFACGGVAIYSYGRRTKA